MFFKSLALSVLCAVPVFSAIIEITDADIKLAGGRTPTTIPVYGRHLAKETKNNLQLLNHLLNLKYAFITETLANISSGDAAYTADAAYTGPWPVAITADDKAPSVTSALNRFQAQDKIQLATVQTLLTSYGVATVPPCTYNFPSTTLSSALVELQLITNMLVGFLVEFDPTTKQETDDMIFAFVASITGVQARHDSTVRILKNEYPSPTPLETWLPPTYAYSIAQAFYAVSCPVNLPFPVLTRLDHPVFGKPDPTKPPPKEVTFSYRETQKINDAKQLYLGWIGQLGRPIYTTFTKSSNMGGGSPPPMVKEWIAKGPIYVVLTDQKEEMNVERLVDRTLAGPSEIILS